MDIRIGARTLFKSCAMPLANVPKLSMRWERKNWASSCFCRVISLLTTSILRGFWRESRNKVQRLTVNTRMPFLVN